MRGKAGGQGYGGGGGGQGGRQGDRDGVVVCVRVRASEREREREILPRWGGAFLPRTSPHDATQQFILKDRNDYPLVQISRIDRHRAVCGTLAR